MRILYHRLLQEGSCERGAGRSDDGGDRTHDPRVNGPLLYQLSYVVRKEVLSGALPLSYQGTKCCFNPPAVS